MKQTPRYSVASITTRDLDLLRRRDELKKLSLSLTDEDIYKRGIESYEKDNNKS